MTQGAGDSDESVPSWLERAAHASVANPDATIRPGATLLGGRSRIERLLGRGGMGVVYLAHDAERAEQVALKILPEARSDAVYRIKQEFRSLSHVRHHHLVELHGRVHPPDRTLRALRTRVSVASIAGGHGDVEEAKGEAMDGGGCPA